MVTRRSRPLVLAVLVALTASAPLVGVSDAAATTGDALANTKLCLNGGWRDLVTSTGAGFASEGDCVLYVVRGGTPLTRYQYLHSQYQVICEERGAFFGDGENGWGCRSSVGNLHQDSYDALSTICQEAGGTPSGTASHAPRRHEVGVLSSVLQPVRPDRSAHLRLPYVASSPSRSVNFPRSSRTTGVMAAALCAGACRRA